MLLVATKSKIYVTIYMLKIRNLFINEVKLISHQVIGLHEKMKNLFFISNPIFRECILYNYVNKKFI